MNETGSSGYTGAVAVPKKFRRHQHGFIYVVKAGDAIKIGFSAEPERRIKNLQTSHQETLETLLITPGSVTLERVLHRRYAQYRIRGEWFHAVPHLITRIKTFVGKREAPPPAAAKLPEAERAALLSARTSAMALRKRAGFERLGAMLVENIEHRMREPDDSDFKAAGVRLYRDIERAMAAH